MAAVVTTSGATIGAALVVKVISVPSTVPLAVVAKALNTYVVCAVKPFTTAEIVVPVADTVVHVDALCALYLNPCAVIASLPTVIVPFNVALSCVIDVAAVVATTGAMISPPLSCSVVNVADTHADSVSSHTALTSTVYVVFAVKPVNAFDVVVRVSAAPEFNLNS